MIINFSCINLGHYIVSNFAIILRDIGFPVSVSNYMLTPVFVFGASFSVCIGWSSDRSGDRAFHIAGTSLWIGVWCLILASINHGDSPAFLVIIGTVAIVPGSGLNALSLSWVNEIYKHDHRMRAVAIAIINAMGNLLGKLATVKTWAVTDSPQFRKFYCYYVSFSEIKRETE